MRSDFYISTNKAELDLSWIVWALQHSYWGEWLDTPRILEAIEHSLCFGAYREHDRTQIAFARVVTDRAYTSILGDMIVAEDMRRQGVGSVLMRAVVMHEWVRPTICILTSRDAREFYRKFGFISLGGEVMKRDPFP